MVVVGWRWVGNRFVFLQVQRERRREKRESKRREAQLTVVARSPSTGPRFLLTHQRWALFSGEIISLHCHYLTLLLLLLLLLLV
jgi:hypothetical protein